MAELRLTHPDEAIARLQDFQRREADACRTDATTAEARALELSQKAARLRLKAMEHDQVADRLAKLLPQATIDGSQFSAQPKKLNQGQDMCAEETTTGYAKSPRNAGPIRHWNDDND